MDQHHQEFERMMRDADQHAEEDRRRRDEAETRNLAESLQYQTERFLAENGDKIPAERKTELTDALGELRSSLAGTDTAAVQAAQEKVARISQEIGGAMYAQAQQEAPATGTGTDTGSTGPAADGEEVVDAEIVDEPGEGGSKA